MPISWKRILTMGREHKTWREYREGNLSKSFRDFTYCVYIYSLSICNVECLVCEDHHGIRTSRYEHEPFTDPFFHFIIVINGHLLPNVIVK